MAADADTVLRTPRLVLRRWRCADREPFAAMNADPRVMAHFPATLTRGLGPACATIRRTRAIGSRRRR